MRILGVSAFYHDSAACIVVDGEIVAAAQEERFSRIKHDAGFPRQAIAYCLEAAGIRARELDYVAFYDKPFLKFERLLETYLAFAPRGFRSFGMAMPLWLKEKLFQKKLLGDELARLDPEVDWRARLLFCEHHLSHAASAFFASPFQQAAVLTMDGVGEWATTSIGRGDNQTLELHQEIHFPHSLGLLYSAFTYYTGFKVNSGEYKLMGLAPFGRPKYKQLIFDHLIDLKADGSFRLDQTYFDYCAGLVMTSPKFHALFQGPPRRPEEPITQHHMDVAASIQAVTEEVVLSLARHAADITGLANLCLAGGVALNCVANGKLLRDRIFEKIWVQPAAGDAGGALGAALYAYHAFCGGARALIPGRDAMSGTFLGPGFSDDETASRLIATGAHIERFGEDTLLGKTVAGLVEGKAVGWFQGRMEFGPRALGGRSILADPRRADMQQTLNLKVKFRESFRPFAPAVLEEKASEWFGIDEPSPYMLMVADLLPKHRLGGVEDHESSAGFDLLKQVPSVVPAITHVDNSARIQTVNRHDNPKFHGLISRFAEQTGCPMLVNTSFNVRGEPVVCTPEEAFRCFMATDIEVLVAGDCYLEKEAQDSGLKTSYYEAFDDD